MKKDTVINDLRSLVLSLDQEREDATMDKFSLEVSRLKEMWKQDVILNIFLQILHAVGKYIKANKTKDHADSFKLLHSTIAVLEKVVSTPDMAPGAKKKLANEVAVKIGQNLAYNSMVWHEIITWYGYKYTGVFSEYISSFSWEDVYSDVLGIDIAGMALKDDSDNYNAVMTKLIYDRLDELDSQPVSIAKKAEKIVKGKWYKGTIYPFTKLKKRNLDIGLDDGYVTPWLIPGICENTKTIPCVVPDINILDEYGFAVDIKIAPKIAEGCKLLSIVYPDGKGEYIVPSLHFPVIMKDILEKEIKRNGPEVNIPNL